MAAQGLSVQLACRVLEVSESGYYARRSRAPSLRSIRHAWLTGVIREVHTASRGTYGIRRVHADLTLGRGIVVGHQAVELLMRRAGIQGISGRPRYRRIPGIATAGDRVERQFHRDQPDQLWVTTSPSIRPGKARCTAPSCSTPGRVAWSGGRSNPRRVPRWSPTRSAWLLTSAGRRARPSFTVTRARSSAPGRSPVAPSTPDYCRRWARSVIVSTMRSSNRSGAECRSSCSTASAGARGWNWPNAIFEYLEIFHNRQRRHSSLSMLTPVEFEARHQPTTAA